MSSKIVIILAILLVSSPLTALVSADEADADALPTLDLYRTSDGKPQNGAILDNSNLGYSADTSPSGTVYTLHEGSVLVSGQSYLMATGDGDYSFHLVGSLAWDRSRSPNPFILETGLRISFYEYSDCSGDSLFSADMRDDATVDVTDNFRMRTHYYVKVEILSTASFETVPNLDNIGFTFTIEEESAFEVYFEDGSGTIINTIAVKNGEKWPTLPVPSLRTGYTFLGWFTHDSNPTRISEGDTVNLYGNTVLHARWWKGSTDTFKKETESGSTVIVTPVTDPVKVLTLDITVTDPDGEVILDEHGIDAGQYDIPLDFNGSGKKNYLDLSKAEIITEAYDALEKHLEDEERETTPRAVLDPSSEPRAEPLALKEIASKDISLYVVSDLGSIEVPPITVEDLSNCDDDVYILLKEAAYEGLTEKQEDAVGSDFAVSVTMESAGVRITEFDGTLTIRIPFDAPERLSSLKVLWVLPDGTVSDTKASYKEGVATFKTDHLSVFKIVYTTYPESPSTLPYMIILFIAPIVGLFALFLFLYKRKKGSYIVVLTRKDVSSAMEEASLQNSSLLTFDICIPKDKVIVKAPSSPTELMTTSGMPAFINTPMGGIELPPSFIGSMAAGFKIMFENVSLDSYPSQFSNRYAGCKIVKITVSDSDKNVVAPSDVTYRLPANSGDSVFAVYGNDSAIALESTFEDGVAVVHTDAAPCLMYGHSIND